VVGACPDISRKARCDRPCDAIDLAVEERDLVMPDGDQPSAEPGVTARLTDPIASASGPRGAAHVLQRSDGVAGLMNSFVERSDQHLVDASGAAPDDADHSLANRCES
jgi:hypothetical protein